MIDNRLCMISVPLKVKNENVSCSVMSDSLRPQDCSLPGFSVHGILQARILEWVAIPFSRLLPDPGIEPKYPTLQADSLLSEPQGKLVNAFIP